MLSNWFERKGWSTGKRVSFIYLLILSYPLIQQQTLAETQYGGTGDRDFGRNMILN
jgi:hypothetical protein